MNRDGCRLRQSSILIGRWSQLPVSNTFCADQGLLGSALARPRNAFAYGEEEVVALAVRLLAGVAMAHAFEQGNKRTAFVAMTEFLITNGYDLVLHDNTGWADKVISLVEHRTTEADFVQDIRPFVIARLLR